MSPEALRAWWSHKQGIEAMSGSSCSEVLERSGWARSVGGVNAYTTLFARAGIRRQAADDAVSALEIYELPSARGCTYVVPKSDFALALQCADPSGEAADLIVAKRYLGVTDQEVDALCTGILDALSDEPMEPSDIKTTLGDLSRSLGEEGKKRGQSTTLPLGLGRLQRLGEIRRVPTNGRLDQQRYGYVRWNENPLKGITRTRDEAYIELAQRYFRWTGPASIAHFQWFSGLGVRAAKVTVDALGLTPLTGTDLLAYPEDIEAMLTFRAPRKPRYTLVSSLDSLLLLRRDVRSLLNDEDFTRSASTGKGLVELGGLQEMSNHVILDRGRIVGLWEFDSYAMRIASFSFVDRCEELNKAIGKMERYIVEDLGDARAFSLDSPVSRKPIIERLRLMT